MKKHLRLTRPRIILSVLALLLIVVTVWNLWGNLTFGITEYTVKSSDLPAAFDGYTIVQISDLHNDSFGENNRDLLTAIEEASPDLIVLTGDLLDSKYTDADTAVEFARRAAEIAPVYMVTGNHESRLSDWSKIRTRLTDAGVIFLDDETVPLTCDADTILLSGLQDPTFWSEAESVDIASSTRNKIDGFAEGNDGFHLLLSHRPELYESYIESDVDLVLTGHAHGGAVRLPFIGGLYSPGEGLFPKYTEGMHSENGTSMIVSRGLGNSTISFRIGNRPELVVITLQCK